jgi:membrane-bound metal-dependent hydrolase YbcI (DUF457 family)
MDTITHGIVGALTGKALFAGRDVPAGFTEDGASHALSSPTARAAIMACTVGSMFPDIDIFAGPLARNPLAIMEWHRNVTHSALLLPLWAFLLTVVSIYVARLLKWKCPRFWILFAIYAAGLATHIFLDVVTSFGTMVWSPLRYSRPAWDWIFILDLSLTVMALAPQLAAWCYREPGKFWRRAIWIWLLLTAGAFGTYLFARDQGYGFPIAVAGVASAIFAAVIFLPTAQGAGFRWTRARWCRAGLALVCVYIALAATAHHEAFAAVENFAAAQPLQVENVAALPLPPTLTHWVGLVSTPQGVWRITFHEPGGAAESKQFYANAESSEFVEQARKLRDVQVFLWFARYPVWRVRQRAGRQTVLEISDVRFFRENVPDGTDDPPPQSKSIGNIQPRRAGFTFEVVFDPGGRVVSSGFQEEP